MSISAQSFGRLVWIDKRGAGRTLHASLGELVLRLQTIRCKAELYADGIAEPIGRCAQAEGHDDKRVKWCWWYDADAGRPIGPSSICGETEGGAS